MPKTSEIARAANVKPNTIRYWARDYADFLSAGANPQKGDTRIFTNEDAAVFMLIASMRNDNANAEMIADSLAAGDRGQWPPESGQAAQDRPGEEETGGDRQLALITQLTAKASSLEGAIGVITEERDNLRYQLAAIQQEAKEAETRAAVAERELEIMRSLADKKKAWWRFWD